MLQVKSVHDLPITSIAQPHQCLSICHLTDEVDGAISKCEHGTSACMQGRKGDLRLLHDPMRIVDGSTIGERSASIAVAHPKSSDVLML